MLKVMGRGKTLILPRWSWLGFSLAFVAIFIVFLWHLGNLTPGLSLREVAYTHSSQSWSSIIANPVNAPHKLLQLGIHQLAPQHPSLLRVASIFFALIFCLAFYRLTVSWFGQAVGLFATLIFACLPLFVISARQATADIMFFSPIVFMGLYNWLIKSKTNKTAAWLSLGLATTIFVYSPGMLVWILTGFLICRRPILRAISEVPAWASAANLLAVTAALASLTLASLKHSQVMKQILLVPTQINSWLKPLEHLGWMFLALIVKTGQTDPLIVGRLPVLNILLIALVIFGAYALWGAARSKALWLGLAGLYALLAAGINDSLIMLALALPSVGVFVAAGLRYLYIEWRSVFPRNPVPKTFALVLIAIVTLTQLYFGLRYSLAAWPNAPATRAAYVLK